jgi:hypothetical protein
MLRCADRCVGLYPPWTPKWFSRYMTIACTFGLALQAIAHPSVRYSTVSFSASRLDLQLSRTTCITFVFQHLIQLLPRIPKKQTTGRPYTRRTSLKDCCRSNKRCRRARCTHLVARFRHDHAPGRSLLSFSSFFAYRSSSIS